MFENNTQEQVENKLLMLKLIEKNTPLTRDEFIRDVNQQNLINLFLIYHYLTELEESELIAIKDNQLTITDRGEAVLELLKDKIPKHLKKENTTQREHPNFHGDIERLNGKFRVTFSIHIHGETPFSITFEVNSYEEAKQWLTQWEERPEPLYVELWRVLDEWKMNQ